MLMLCIEVGKDWTFREWLTTFMQERHPYYDGAEDDEYYDDPLPDHGLPGGEDEYYEELDESIIESLIIVGLAAALAFLVYYRQQRQQQGAQQENQQPQQAQPQGQVPNAAAPGEQPVPGQQADGGFFPPNEDPNFGVWVAGGVGH